MRERAVYQYRAHRNRRLKAVHNKRWGVVGAYNSRIFGHHDYEWINQGPMSIGEALTVANSLNKLNSLPAYQL